MSYILQNLSSFFLSRIVIYFYFIIIFVFIINISSSGIVIKLFGDGIYKSEYLALLFNETCVIILV